jgi:hypothetical protein
MDTQSQNYICREHSGVIERIKDCEDNVSKLWGKINKIQAMTLGVFIALSLNLIGVIFLILR